MKSNNIIPSAILLQEALKGNYAVPAFNVENMETVQGVIKAANYTNTPVIIQTTPSSIMHANSNTFYAMVNATINSSCVPVSLHLDHGTSLALVRDAIASGYTSVMFDGSAFPLEKNIELTRSAVEAGKASSVSVEGELGCIGGKEDDLSLDSGLMTVPKDAERFERETGVDALAVAIGTAHGLYKKTPKLNFSALTEIRKVTGVPLVLHGTSGVPDCDVRKCISLGISKVNYATDLRVAFTNAVKNHINENPDNHDPKKFLAAGREAVFNRAVELIEICKSLSKKITR